MRVQLSLTCICSIVWYLVLCSDVKSLVLIGIAEVTLADLGYYTQFQVLHDECYDSNASIWSRQYVMKSALSVARTY